MKNKDQLLTEILFTEPSDNVSSKELVHDHDLYNKLMQIKLLKENFDTDYETGFNSDLSIKFI